ncbi:MAG: hypothetical protein U1F43_26150 [Myxococcota bacterium]
MRLPSVLAALVSLLAPAACGDGAGSDGADATSGDTTQSGGVVGIWVDDQGHYLHVEAGPNAAVPAFAGAKNTYVRGTLRTLGRNPLPESYGPFPGDLGAVHASGDTLKAAGTTWTRVPTWPGHDPVAGGIGRTDWITEPLGGTGPFYYYHGAVGGGRVAIVGLGGQDFANGQPAVPGVAVYGSGGAVVGFVPADRLGGSPYDVAMHPDGALTVSSLGGHLAHVGASGDGVDWSLDVIPPDDTRIYGGLVADGDATWILVESVSTGWHLAKVDGAGHLVSDAIVAGTDVELSSLVAADGGVAALAYGKAGALVSGAALGPSGEHTIAVVAWDGDGHERWRRWLGPDPGRPVALYPAPAGVLVDVQLGAELSAGIGPLSGSGDDRAIVRLGADGKAEWQASILELSYGVPATFAVLPDGRVVGVTAKGNATWLQVWDACGQAHDGIILAADCGCTFYPGNGGFWVYQALATDDGGLVLLGGGGDAYLDMGALAYPAESDHVYLHIPSQAIAARVDVGAPVAAPASCAPAGDDVALTVTVTGSGSVDVNGETCASGTCTYALPRYTALTLTPTPAAGQRLAAWSVSGSDADCRDAGACSFQLGGPTQVTAAFEASHVAAVLPLGTAIINALASAPGGVALVAGSYEEGFGAGGFTLADSPGANVADYAPYAFVMSIGPDGLVKSLVSVGDAATFPRSVGALDDGSPALWYSRGGAERVDVLGAAPWAAEVPFVGGAEIGPVGSGDALLFARAGGSNTSFAAIGSDGPRFSTSLDGLVVVRGSALGDGASGWWVYGRGRADAAAGAGGWTPGTSATLVPWLVRLDASGAVVAGHALDVTGESPYAAWLSRDAAGVSVAFTDGGSAVVVSPPSGASYALAGLDGQTWSSVVPFDGGWLAVGASGLANAAWITANHWADGAVAWRASYGITEDVSGPAPIVGMAAAGPTHAVLGAQFPTPTVIGGETVSGSAVLVLAR